MREIRNGKYQYTRVGAERIDRAIIPVRPYYEIVDEWIASGDDVSVGGLTSGVWYRRTRFPGYPMVVAEDTAFISSAFDQESPHTDGIFDVKPGVRLVFGEPDEDKAAGHNQFGELQRGDCSLVNVKIPDEAEVYGGNSVHRVKLGTTKGDKPTVSMLCECMECCTYRGELLTEMPRDLAGRVKHDIVWERTIERRKNSATVTSDRAVAAASNAAAATKYGVVLDTGVQSLLMRGA